MVMPLSDEVEGGPFVLRLHKWGPEQFNLELSDFCEALISPTRELLLLLSYQHEAILFPLITGEISSFDKDQSVRGNVEGLEESSSWSAEQTTVCLLDSSDNVPCTKQAVDSVSNLGSSSNRYTAISGIKSSTWGHWGDTYGDSKKSSFKELLVVSDFSSITVHTFLYPHANLEVNEPTSEGASLDGKWIEWGPAHGVGNAGSTGSCSTQKIWLKSYLTEINSAEFAGNFLVRFPGKSILPHSAEVVSFSIFESTLKFLEFHSFYSPKERQGSGATSARGGEALISDCMSDLSSMNDNGSHDGMTYYCPKVFSNSSNCIIGLVLTLSEHPVFETCEEFLRNAKEVFVVVVKLYQWGMQWVCAVKLGSLYTGPEWADFQFTEDFLICLNSAGFICIWNVNTGSPVTSFDVLKDCGLIAKYDSKLDEPFLSGKRVSSVAFDGSQEEENGTWGANRNGSSSIAIVSSRKFRRILVSSYSSLLAAIDEHGVIYVLCADDHIYAKHCAINNLMATSQCSNIGMLEVWRIAGAEIGGPKVFPGLRKVQSSKASEPSFNCHSKDSNQMRRELLYTKGKRRRVGTDLSGFSSVSQIKGSPVPLETKMSSTPMRRIFLPVYRSNKEDAVCLSPFGITRLIRSCGLKEDKNCRIVHTCLHVDLPVVDERDFTTRLPSRKFMTKEFIFKGKSIGSLLQGYLYMVTQDGLFVILPSVSISSDLLQVETLRYWQPSTAAHCNNHVEHFMELYNSRELWNPWQIEVLDRVLLYEGPEEADCICLQNDWDLKIARLRWMELALHYLKPDEIEKSLDMLAQVNLAEEGILRLLFTSLYQISCKRSDNEVALAFRLLSLAACFATKMVRKYGLGLHMQDEQYSLPKHYSIQISNARKLSEMAHFLEVIRHVRSQLSTKGRRLGQGVSLDGGETSNVVDTYGVQDDSLLPIVEADGGSSSLQDLSDGQKAESSFPGSEFEPNNLDELALPLAKSSATAVDVLELDGNQKMKVISLENSRDMITRWEMDHLDLRMVVKDALQASRLPLAVLQLHIQHQRELVAEDSHDMFSEVGKIGRAIAYDLFLKGESGLAVGTLQKLGEDIEFILRQLLYGTVRRSLRAQIGDEMKSNGYLRTYELHMLDKISLLERLYPSSRFWVTFLGKQKELTVAASTLTPEPNKLKIVLHISDNLTIECGDVDGVVCGLWVSVDNGYPVSEICEDNGHAGYWACAFAWSDAWDDRTMERIVLDQPFHMGIHIPWESQLEYYLSHNDLDEVYRLLDVIPSSVLADATLKVNLELTHSARSAQTDMKHLDYDMYIHSAEELEPVYITIPNVKTLTFSATSRCSSWLKLHLEQELAKKYIFLQEYWGSTVDIVRLLARAGLIVTPKVSAHNKASNGSPILELIKIDEEFHETTSEALHKLVVRYCTQYNLPSLLDLYLDNLDLADDEHSLSSLLEAASDCQWAKWLLLSRIKGHEYEASFLNARSNSSLHLTKSSNLSALDIDDIIRTVDDMAEGGGEMAALATLMYATPPMQKCVCSGSVKWQCSDSNKCTMENLRPCLQQFPTLWRTLVSSCFGQDMDGCSFNSAAGNVYGKSALSYYLNWRESIFMSTGGDTNLIQMLPCWFPKSIRRLLKLFFQSQGPLGWHNLSCDIPSEKHFLYAEHSYDFNSNGKAALNALSWESNIQESIERELYSSLEENAFGVEHHLHRGRALAAFNHLLGLRALKLKSVQDPSGQANIQSNVQMLLAPLSQSEGSLLSSVMPLAIMHFEDTVLVASCAFLLELCGLSASMLRVDIAVLRRISSYYSLITHGSQHDPASSKGSLFNAAPHKTDLAMSLARALADDYVHHDRHKSLELKNDGNHCSRSKQPSHSLRTVLHHLERASLPTLEEGRTCGSWLSTGIGDGSEFRSQQKDTSQRWKLVTTFCQMHNIPLSTKYLALLANDNDWVGFLTEAQMEGYPMDIIIQVAAKEFSDPRLKTHILTVLRSMHSAKKTSNSSTNERAERSIGNSFPSECNTVIPAELFRLLADCEKERNPGEALLIKAKDLRWPLLAIIASCFSDVSALSCLTVWLEITAARETSSIKVNDIHAKIAKSVGLAVEAMNALPAGSRTLTFRYNRRNPKRRRLMEHEPGSMVGPSFNSSAASSPAMVSIVQGLACEEETKWRFTEQIKVCSDVDEGLSSLTNMVAVLCEQHLFLPLLRAFEMFLPSCSLLPFIRSLQAFSQMRLSEAAAHLASFSARIKEESLPGQLNITRDAQIKTNWISSTAVKAAESMLSTCPSAYERRCLLQLLAAADFGDGGSAATYFRRLFWKINLAEPSLRKDDEIYLGNETLDDASLLTALEKNGQWEKARNWARQLESIGSSWKSAVHHVTETQAEALVAEWKEFLWDVPEERSALWNHCQTLFLRYSFPPLQAGLFFFKHAEAIEKEIPARELHEMLLLSLQWLSGTMSQCNPVYPLHLLREIETRVWLLAVESEAQSKADGDFTSHNSVHNLNSGNSASIIEQTASIITRMDNHINAMKLRTTEKNGSKESIFAHNRHSQTSDSNNSLTTSNTRSKRRGKAYFPLRRPVIDGVDNNIDTDESPSSPRTLKSSIEPSKNLQLHEENMKIEVSVSGWEEKVKPAELERAVLSLLEFGQITAAKQLQHKLSPSNVPSELLLVDAALKLAALSSSGNSGEVAESLLDHGVLSVLESHDVPRGVQMIDPLQSLEYLATKCGHGCGRGLCRRIVAVVKAAKVLGLAFSEAFEKRPIELLQLLSLKAQDSLEEAKLLVQTHTMPSSSIAQILAESFLKGLLAAHRGGYMDSQKEEGPAPLLWRFSDFLKWAELCPSEQGVGHALMRLVMTGQEIPHACEVELLILAHHFYKSSACLDGVDVLVTLAANRVESYVSEGDFACLARLITGVSNFHALNFILNILIENGQLELLLEKYSTAETASSTADAVRGFRMAVLTSLKLFNPHDLDAFALVYRHFDMKHEAASLLESRSNQCIRQWFMRRDKYWQTEDLLDSMCYLIEAAEVYSTIDAGHKTDRACARASLLSLQVRIPDIQWLDLSETNARRVLVEQSRFPEALIVAEAYNLNQSGEWALVLWNQMLKPDLVEQFVAEFVAVLPLQSSMLLELARYYRAEVAARGDQSHFSVWLSPGGLPAEWLKHLGRSFRSLLRRTRDLRVRMQLATVATGFPDVVDSCMKLLDKVPENAGPLILRRGHGGAYLPLM